MKYRRFFYCLLLGFLAVGLGTRVFLSSSAQAEDKSSEDKIRLIVRGDDIGFCHAANMGCIKSYREGIMTSVEVMVPCPWFPEAAKMLRENPGLDVGIHLTLTSEWDLYKWEPLTEGRSLVNKDGYFYAQTREWDRWPPGTGFWDAKPKVEEVEKELRAQIEKAMKEIPQVSHLSAHMGTATCTAELRALVRRLAKEYDLDINLRDYGVQYAGGMGDSKDPPHERIEALVKTLENLKPGLWLLVEHPGMDTPEMRAIGHPGYEHVASDRDGVTKAFTSDEVKEVIRRRGIKLLSYGDLKVSGAKKLSAGKPRRFFSDSSFWNQPIADNPEIDPRSDHFISLLKKEPSGHRFVINCEGWAIPIYEADSSTPTHMVKRRGRLEAIRRGLEPTSERFKRFARFGHGPGFGKDVPIPDHAVPDPGSDAHMAIVDWSRMLVWDMWGAQKQPNGTWASYTGMVYRLDGDGIFRTEDFPAKNTDSIHFYGPGRAAGVPIIAGLIRYDEVMNGEIRHKIAAATRFNALQEFVFPAAWTDGYLKGGIPEGAVIQLAPDLDLDQFDMLPGEKIIAKALQKYGVVIVDNAGGSPLYAEGLYGQEGKSWDGIIDKFGGIDSIPLDHYRVLKLVKITPKGDDKHRRPQ